MQGTASRPQMCVPRIDSEGSGEEPEVSGSPGGSETWPVLMHIVQIELRLEPDLSAVNDERMEAQQMVTNLLLNASVAIEEPGVGVGEPPPVQTADPLRQAARSAVV